jgi:hypothetical protein
VIAERERVVRVERCPRRTPGGPAEPLTLRRGLLAVEMASADVARLYGCSIIGRTAIPIPMSMTMPPALTPARSIATPNRVRTSAKRRRQVCGLCGHAHGWP